MHKPPPTFPPFTVAQETKLDEFCVCCSAVTMNACIYHNCVIFCKLQCCARYYPHFPLQHTRRQIRQRQIDKKLHNWARIWTQDSPALIQHSVHNYQNGIAFWLNGSPGYIQIYWVAEAGWSTQSLPFVFRNQTAVCMWQDVHWKDIQFSVQRHL